MDADTRSQFMSNVIRIIAVAVGAVVVAVLRTLPLFIVVVLRLTKPIIYYPLSLASVGAVGVTIVFAVTGRWHDAFGAALAAVVASLTLGIYTAAAEWLDPKIFDRSQLPPWWWYI